MRLCYFLKLRNTFEFEHFVHCKNALLTVDMKMILNKFNKFKEHAENRDFVNEPNNLRMLKFQCYVVKWSDENELDSKAFTCSLWCCAWLNKCVKWEWMYVWAYLNMLEKALRIIFTAGSQRQRSYLWENQNSVWIAMHVYSFAFYTRRW